MLQLLPWLETAFAIAELVELVVLLELLVMLLLELLKLLLDIRWAAPLRAWLMASLELVEFAMADAA